ncbi:MAG TPA: hypothetical protein VN325_23325 [Steroidobacteraceae bacterium]|nr:hypothetical protein [Steroidobacteraceae bacterium]
MSDYNYLKPKVAVGNLGERKKKNGMFQNVPPYPELGGFSSASKVPERQRPLALEKGDLVRKGKPV